MFVRTGKKNTYNLGFVGRHYNSDAITYVLQGISIGKSTTKATDGLAKKGLRPNLSTVWRWVRDFGGMLKTLSDSLAIHVGYDWCSNEIYYKMLGGRGCLALWIRKVDS